MINKNKNQSVFPPIFVTFHVALRNIYIFDNLCMHKWFSVSQMKKKKKRFQCNFGKLHTRMHILMIVYLGHIFTGNPHRERSMYLKNYQYSNARKQFTFTIPLIEKQTCFLRNFVVNRLVSQFICSSTNNTQANLLLNNIQQLIS